MAPHFADMVVHTTGRVMSRNVENCRRHLSASAVRRRVATGCSCTVHPVLGRSCAVRPSKIRNESLVLIDSDLLIDMTLDGSCS